MSPLTYYWWGGQQQFVISIQLNFSSMASLGTEESGHCKEVDVVERFNPLTAFASQNGLYKTTLLQNIIRAVITGP